MTGTYYKQSPEEITEDISRSTNLSKIRILGKNYLIYPSVYPSDRFRTTNFLLKNIQPLLQDATVCDMGCGMGIIGLYSLQHGAKSAVQADINPTAVKNAIANKELYHHTDQELHIYQSDCFDNIPPQTFDLIIFNIPFHSDPHLIQSSIEYAFHDPDFQSTKKFLYQLKEYSHPDTKTIIAFSNKGDTQTLEKIFSDLNFRWSLWKIANADQKYDNRLYLLEHPLFRRKK